MGAIALLNRIRQTFGRLVERPETLEETVSLDGGANWVAIAELERARQARDIVSQEGQVLATPDFLFLLSPDDGRRFERRCGASARTHDGAA